MPTVVIIIRCNLRFAAIKMLADYKAYAVSVVVNK